MGTKSFPAVKRPGRSADHQTPSPPPFLAPRFRMSWKYRCASLLRLYRHVMKWPYGLLCAAAINKSCSTKLTTVHKTVNYWHGILYPLSLQFIYIRTWCTEFTLPSASESGGGALKPIQITGIRGSGARLFCIHFCVSRDNNYLSTGKGM